MGVRKCSLQFQLLSVLYFWKACENTQTVKMVSSAEKSSGSGLKKYSNKQSKIDKFNEGQYIC